MAIDFYKIGKGGSGSFKTIDYSSAFQPLSDVFNTALESSLKKTSELMSKMPNGVSIDKVDESIRPQVTEFLSKHKNDYARAAQVVSTSIPGSSQYSEAMEVINGVKSKFENLNLGLTSYQTSKKNNLENFDLLATINDNNTRLDHSNIANGDALKSFQIDDSGNASFMSANGSRVNFTDYKSGFVDDGAMIKDYLTLAESAEKRGDSGKVFRRQDFELAVKQMFRVNGPEKTFNFAYDGVKTGSLLDDSQPVEFIKQYIFNKDGKRPEDEGYAELFEKYKKDPNVIDAFGTHLVDVLEDQYYNPAKSIYDTKKNTKSKATTDLEIKEVPTKLVKDAFIKSFPAVSEKDYDKAAKFGDFKVSEDNTFVFELNEDRKIGNKDYIAGTRFNIDDIQKFGILIGTMQKDDLLDPGKDTVTPNISDNEKIRRYPSGEYDTMFGIKGVRGRQSIRPLQLLELFRNLSGKPLNKKSDLKDYLKELEEAGYSEELQNKYEQAQKEIDPNLNLDDIAPITLLKELIKKVD